MKKVGIIAAIFAIICGIALYLYLGSVERRVAEARVKQQEPVEMADVVIAAERIPPYTAITEEMLRLESYPAEYVNKQTAKSFDEVIGLKADGTIAEGEIILVSKLGTSEELGASLSYDVPDGMRAMTIDMGVSAGVGGYLTKGDLIDLMLFMSTGASEDDEDTNTDKKTGSSLVTEAGVDFPTQQSITTVVLEAANILALGDVSFTAEGSGVYSSITLALSPADCLKLFTAMKQAQAGGGELYATLRQRDDVSETDTGIYSFADVMKSEERP